MASHKNAEKCIRQTTKRTLINRRRISRVRTSIKKFEALDASATPETLTAAFHKAESEMARAVNKGLVHRNTLARKVSRMAKRMKALSGTSAA